MAQEMYDLTKLIVEVAFFAVAGIIIVRGVMRKKSGKKDDKK